MPCGQADGSSRTTTKTRAMASGTEMISIGMSENRLASSSGSPASNQAMTSTDGTRVMAAKIVPGSRTRPGWPRPARGPNRPRRPCVDGSGDSVDSGDCGDSWDCGDSRDCGDCGLTAAVVAGVASVADSAPSGAESAGSADSAAGSADSAPGCVRLGRFRLRRSGLPGRIGTVARVSAVARRAESSGHGPTVEVPVGDGYARPSCVHSHGHPRELGPRLVRLTLRGQAPPDRRARAPQAGPVTTSDRKYLWPRFEQISF